MDNTYGYDLLTEDQKEEEKKRLYAEKTALLNKHGVFGGGELVNLSHRRINDRLEALGVDPNS